MDKTAELGDRQKAAKTDGADMTQVAANEAAGKKEKTKKTPKEKQPSNQGKKKDTAGGDLDTKGINTKKEDDLANWYQEVLQKGDFLEYSDIPGCYILNVCICGRRTPGLIAGDKPY